MASPFSAVSVSPSPPGNGLGTIRLRLHGDVFARIRFSALLAPNVFTCLGGVHTTVEMTATATVTVTVRYVAVHTYY